MLGWESTKYWEARNRLLDMGLVGKAHGGPGGTTFIIDQQPKAQIVDVEAADITPAPMQQDPYPDESSLYGPLMAQIEQNWARSEAYDGFIVANTARLGRRLTGGSWTRPDICLVGIRKFKFIRNPVVDVVTFEVKTRTDVTVKAVLEALSHRQASTLAYVVFTSCPSTPVTAGDTQARATEARRYRRRIASSTRVPIPMPTQ
jgi:hypothetical protein